MRSPLLLPLICMMAGPVLVAPAHADALDDKARAIFETGYTEACVGAFDEAGKLLEAPQRFELEMSWAHGEPEPVILWQFGCQTAAYNTTAIFLLHSEFEGIMPLTVPSPVLDIEHEDPEDRDSAVKSVKILSWTAEVQVINAQYDKETGTIEGYSLWRGLGDAFETGTWTIQNGGAQILHYEVDASYDEKVEPQLVLDFP